MKAFCRNVIRLSRYLHTGYTTLFLLASGLAHWHSDIFGCWPFMRPLVGFSYAYYGIILIVLLGLFVLTELFSHFARTHLRRNVGESAIVKALLDVWHETLCI